MESIGTKSIQGKAIGIFVAILVVIMTIFNFYIYFTSKSTKEAKLTTFAEFTSNRLAKNLAAPLWDMETEKIDNIIQFEMAEESIYGAIIKDSEGKTIISGLMRDENWAIKKTNQDIVGDYITIQKSISKDNEKLGIIVIYFSSKFIEEEIRSAFISSSLFFAFLTILIAITLFIILRKVVIQPVNSVVELANKLKNGDFSVRLQATEDEIGMMIQSINDFAEDLQSALSNTIKIMIAVAEGNLSEQLNLELKGDLDDLKVSINKSIKMLGDTIAEVVSASEKVKNGAAEISSSANTLANGTTQQAAAIEEMSSSISEFSSQTKANNDNAAQAQQLSHQTLEIVARGNTQMESMLASIKEIHNKSSEVSKVIKVIDEIAFQTNLLALNAAVEAARAGKYGKGFAVVAEEVRNLAGRSAEAAKNTTDLIEASINEVDKGVKNADQTAAVLTEISGSIDKTNDLVGEISSASKEQAIGIEEINRGLTQVNEIVQQNSSISEETASSCEELSNQATQLQSQMGRFKLSSKISQSPIREEEVIAQPEILEHAPIEMKQVEATPNTKQKVLVLDDDEFGKY